jgi:hypothetical protein
LVQRSNELRAALLTCHPESLAEHTGADFLENQPGEGYFSLLFWNRPTRITYPELIAWDGAAGRELPAFLQAMLLYHCYTADGSPLVGRWISFSELPDGRFYTQAFQGYTGGELARAIQDRAIFERAALKAGGILLPGDGSTPGTLAFRFQALPRIPLLVAFWEGDEDFPGTFQVLFDASARHYMPTDGCALLGSTLCRMLLKAM